MIACADGRRHYSEKQVRQFGLQQLIDLADRNGCGPHVWKHAE